MKPTNPEKMGTYKIQDFFQYIIIPIHTILMSNVSCVFRLKFVFDSQVAINQSIIFHLNYS